MPFTLAHPAAALPLRRSLGAFGCGSALIVGSMIPDLAHFVPLRATRIQSHSVPGLFWFCLPVGLLAWSLYRLLLGPFAIALLPLGVTRRLTPEPAALRSVEVLGAAPSVLVGALTHVVWDAFTHSSGAAVQALPALQAPVPLAFGYSPRIFTLLQHGSTAVGLGLLALWGVRWYRSAQPRTPPDSRPLPAWVKVVMSMAIALPTMATALGVAWSQLANGASTFRQLQLATGRAVFYSGTVFLLLLLLTALAWHLARRARLVE